MQKVFSEDQKSSSLRLREGEYQYNLARAIGSCQLELSFPDVRDIVNMLYGEERTKDVQFIRKIQTILKKMEKSGIVTILPKKKPWELQRYALLSFRFKDAENNPVSLAAENELEHAKGRLQLYLSQQPGAETGWGKTRIRGYILALAFIVASSYVAIVWNFLQPVVSPLVFIPAFCISIVGSIMLGRFLSRD